MNRRTARLTAPWRVPIALSLLVLAGEAGAATEVHSPAIDSSLQSAIATLSSLDTHVRFVTAGTTWCEGSDRGQYRLVVFSGGFEEVYDHLYVQLLAIDDERHDVIVKRTIPISESDGFSLFFEGLSMKPSGRGVCNDAVVEGYAIRRLPDGERRERVRLRVTPKGHYTITFQH